MVLMQTAEMLSMSLAAVRQLPASEITLWMAYAKLKNEPKKTETETEQISTVDRFRGMIGV